MHHWLFLSGAILFEVAGTISMKLSEGFTRPIPSVLIFVFYIVSFVALTFALEKIEVSTAYTIWAGVGTALVAIIGFIYFGDSATVKVNQINQYYSNNNWCYRFKPRCI